MTRFAGVALLVTAVVYGRQVVAEPVSVEGYVVPSTERTLVSRVTSDVVQLLVAEGDRVKRGDLLVKLDPRPVQLMVKERRAELEGCRAERQAAEVQVKMAKVTEGQTKQRLESVERSVAERHRADQEATDRSAQQSKSEMFRLGQLKSDAALAELRRLLAEAQLQRQRALVQVAEVRLELAEIPLANTRIVAPFEGIIARVHVLSGGAIVAHVTPMIDLRDPDPVVEVNLPVAQVARLSSKTVTVLRRGSEKEYVGKIVFLAPRVDRVMQTVRARIALEVPEDADQALMPGLLVGVRFELRD